MKKPWDDSHGEEDIAFYRCPECTTNYDSELDERHCVNCKEFDGAEVNLEEVTYKDIWDAEQAEESDED